MKKLHNRLLMRVNPSEHIQRHIFWYGYYEKEAVLTWEAWIQTDFIVVDIGANNGYYSLIAAPKAAKVYAFDPSPEQVNELQQNLHLNHIGNVDVSQLALSNRQEKVALYLSSSDNTGMTSLQPADNFSGKTIMVDTTTLDQWLEEKNIPRIHLVKIDTEGAEMLVLQGMHQQLLKHHPVVFIEIVEEQLKKFGHDHVAIYDFFTSLHYHGYQPVAPGKLQRIRTPMDTYTAIFIHQDQQLPPGVQVL